MSKENLSQLLVLTQKWITLSQTQQNLTAETQKIISIQTIVKKALKNIAKKEGGADTIFTHEGNELSRRYTVIQTKLGVVSAFKNDWQQLKAKKKDLKQIEELLQACKDWLQYFGQHHAVLNPTEKTIQLANRPIVSAIATEYNRLLQLNKTKIKTKGKFKKTLVVAEDTLNKLNAQLQNTALTSADRAELVAQQSIMEQFQKDLIEYATKVEFKIKNGKPFNPNTKERVNADGQVVLFHGEVLVQVANSSKDPKKNAAMQAHELQHMIQYGKGQFGFTTKEGKGHTFLYDVEDEVEAYKVQFIVAANSLPKLSNGASVTSLRQIDAAYVRSIQHNGTAIYATLPNGPLNATMTLAQLDNVSGNNHIQNNLPNLLQQFTFNNVWNNHRNTPLKDLLAHNQDFARELQLAINL